MGGLSGTIVPVTAFQQNCTLLYDDETRRGVVVDPGGDVPLIVEAIGRERLTIEAIWLTHGHIDHAGGAMALRRELGVRIVGPHRADEAMLANLEAQAAMFGVPGAFENCTPDRWLEEGDTVGFGVGEEGDAKGDGRHDFAVLHTPGHAPGHVVFHHPAAAFLHAGDVLFRGSIGRTDLPGGDHETLLASIRDKVLPLGDHVTFVCGHGPGGSLGEERRTNPFLTGRA